MQLRMRVLMLMIVLTLTSDACRHWQVHVTGVDFRHSGASGWTHHTQPQGNAGGLTTHCSGVMVVKCVGAFIKSC